MTEMTVVGCTDTKHDYATKATTLYEPSMLFRKRKAVAKQSEHWGILSAKYGYVEPDAVIDTYNVHISDRDRELWAGDVMDDLTLVLDQRDVDTVQILAGKGYVDPLTPELERLGYEVLDPLRGKMIGERLSRLTELANENQNKSGV